MCETTARPSAELQILRRLGYFGYYLHTHWGGRNGKQHILVELLAHDGCMTQRDLQEASCITSASLSEVVTKLETEGLLSRERSETDRRQLTLTLTDEGRRRARNFIESRREFERLAFDCLTPEERDHLLETLDRVAGRWEEIEAQGREEAACSSN
ncbi:MAG TPA: MarR family transcriptional regulator [Candidatus Olsenella excrementavium]|uniref:MarR family transcriptional regulator n=1 Tax=Candidatus Olsenella excrementavium TaxID=2838709 RepID=A0A9D2CHN4_9ACTN|nr:MarR family transcriptional regulator [Candidatus Olsenella excrementavium]